MTRDEVNTYLCAVLTTLNELDHAVESILYMGMGCDINKWNTIKDILIGANLANCSGNIVTITLTGRAMADKINAAMAIRE